MFKQAGLQVTFTQEITKRHQLIPWAERQGCSTEIIEKLAQMIIQAPPKVADWLQVEDFGTHFASFINHHILIAGKTLVNGV